MFAGEANGEALKTLRSSRLDDLFDELVRQYAVIVVDLPPLAMIAESSRLLNQVDRVLMVTQAGVTPARLVRSAMALIPEEKRSGVVLNRTRPAFGPFHWLSRLFHRTI
jgi:Mrp family chromosome partitioning ATPase